VPSVSAAAAPSPAVSASWGGRSRRPPETTKAAGIGGLAVAPHDESAVLAPSDTLRCYTGARSVARLPAPPEVGGEVGVLGGRSPGFDLPGFRPCGRGVSGAEAA
jgi:hypothetical protein